MRTVIFAVLTVAALLCVAGQVRAAEEKGKEVKGRLLLITGTDQFHDWRASLPTLREDLEKGGFQVVVTEDPWVLTTPGMKAYDGIVMQAYPAARWPAPVEQALVGLVKGGMGIGIVHSADNSFPGWTEFEDMVGLLWRVDEVHKAGHDHYGPYTVKIVDKQHFITRGMEDFPTTDELYRDLTKYSDFQVLAEAFSKDKQRDYPILMVKTYGQGRVFHTVLGHDAVSMSSAGFQRTLQRGMLWAIKKDN
jgi:uncharacterized protein